MTGDGTVPVALPEFPRLHSRTQGFSLGVPRRLTLGPDRVLFLRGDAEEQPFQVFFVGFELGNDCAAGMGNLEELPGRETVGHNH